MFSVFKHTLRVPSAAFFGSRRIVNFYSTLGVERNASMEDIRAAYLRLAKKYHPDLNKGENTRQRFDSIKMAYEALSVQKNRDLYDVYMDSDPYEWKNEEFERFYDTSRQFSRKGTKYDRKYNKNNNNFWGDGAGETEK